MEHLLCVRQDWTYSTLFAQTTQGLGAAVIPTVTDKDTEAQMLLNTLMATQPSTVELEFSVIPQSLSCRLPVSTYRKRARAIRYTFIFFIIGSFKRVWRREDSVMIPKCPSSSFSHHQFKSAWEHLSSWKGGASTLEYKSIYLTWPWTWVCCLFELEFV